MHKKEFWENYRASQVKHTLSDDAKRRIVADAQQGGAEGDAFNHRTKRVASTQAGNSSLKQEHYRLRKSNARFVIPITACLAAIALIVGLVSLDDEKGTTGVVPDFKLQAYAASTDTILEMGSDNRIIFSREIALEGVEADKNAYLTTEGYYTGCLFRVEGEGIERIQASTSSGVLYRQHTERITRGENPDRWNELVNWKPSKRGLGEYYSNYDETIIWGSSDDLPKESPDKLWNVSLVKKLGSTIDIPVTEGSPEYSFGFWTNEDYGEELTNEDASDAIIDLFDGATLTVTVTFSDGRTTTQIVEIYSGDALSSLEQDENGRVITTITPELVDPEAEGLERYVDYTHILYGVVKEINNEPFPGSLVQVNEFEDVVIPYVFERRELLRQITFEENGQTKNAKIAQKDIHSATDSLMVQLNDDADPYSISNLKLKNSKNLPGGVSLDDLNDGFGNWEYFNKVTNEVDGYTLDSEGTPSEGFSWVTLEISLTNESDSATEITADGGFYGSLAIYDAQGDVYEVSCRSFALEGGFDASGARQSGCIAFQPGETKTVRWMLIAPDYALQDPLLFYLAWQGFSEDANKNLQGFEVNFS